jgi:hypothetical protein
MSWDAPELCWQFPIGDDPPADLPAEWASATRAVTRDLGCGRHGRAIGFHNVMWKIAADDGSVCVGFAVTGDADVRAYQRSLGYRLNTTAAQATVWMADDVQYELTGYEFVEWPIVDRRILVPQIIGDQAAWVDPKTEIVIARIGELCGATDAAPSIAR